MRVDITALFSGHGDPRHKFARAVCGICISERGKRLGKPTARVDASDFAALDQRGNDRVVEAAFVTARERGVLAFGAQTPDRSLDGISIELDAAILYTYADIHPCCTPVRWKHRSGGKHQQHLHLAQNLRRAFEAGPHRSTAEAAPDTKTPSLDPSITRENTFKGAHE